MRLHERPRTSDADLLAILDAGPIEPEALAALSVHHRRQIEDGIATLIDVLDLLSPDPDLEDSADDADVTAPERHGCGFLRCAPDDVEIECEDEGACIQSQPHDEETDGEPSLGAPEIHHDQRRWGQGSGSRELDHDEHTGLVDGGWQHRIAIERARQEARDLLRRVPQ